MKIVGHRGFLYVAVMVGIYALASTVFGQVARQGQVRWFVSWDI